MIVKIYIFSTEYCQNFEIRILEWYYKKAATQVAGCGLLISLSMFIRGRILGFINYLKKYNKLNVSNREPIP